MTVKQAIKVLEKLPLDAVLVDAHYVEMDIAGKPQEHLDVVDVFLNTDGNSATPMPGKKLVIVD